ncbi:NERD domain-containing protein [Nocardia halotolerans]|uniref:NERD domain-containing protein n=1 Tax=Nocardia halotolerans TaxID=1755878 RepID=A0ABV8VD13_9NOCA
MIVVVADETELEGAEQIVGAAIRDPALRAGGVAVFRCHVPENRGGSVEVDALVCTPQTVTIVEVKGFTTRQEGTLATPPNGPWTIDGEPAALYHAARVPNPFVQVRRQVFAAKSLLQQTGIFGWVNAVIALVPQPGAQITIEETRIADGYRAVLVDRDDPSALHGYFDAETGRTVRLSVDDVGRVFAALNLGHLLPAPEALTAQGFPLALDPAVTGRPAAPPAVEMAKTSVSDTRTTQSAATGTETAVRGGSRGTPSGPQSPTPAFLAAIDRLAHRPRPEVLQRLESSSSGGHSSSPARIRGDGADTDIRTADATDRTDAEAEQVVRDDVAVDAEQSELADTTARDAAVSGDSEPGIVHRDHDEVDVSADEDAPEAERAFPATSLTKAGSAPVAPAASVGALRTSPADTHFDSNQPDPELWSGAAGNDTRFDPAMSTFTTDAGDDHPRPLLPDYDEPTPPITETTEHRREPASEEDQSGAESPPPGPGHISTTTATARPGHYGEPVASSAAPTLGATGASSASRSPETAPPRPETGPPEDDSEHWSEWVDSERAPHRRSLLSRLRERANEVKTGPSLRQRWQNRPVREDSAPRRTLRIGPGVGLLLFIALFGAGFFAITLVQASGFEMSDYDRMCGEDKKPFANAAPYQRDGARPIYLSGALTTMVRADDSSAWNPKDPSSVQLIACMRQLELRDLVQTCQYGPAPDEPVGRTVNLFRATYEIVVYELRTGREVAKATMLGERYSADPANTDPDRCRAAADAPDYLGRRLGQPSAAQLTGFLTPLVHAAR